MTTPNGKSAPKGEISRIGNEPDALARFLEWLRRYATLLSVAFALVLVIIGANALLWQTTSTRFDDTAARINDTKAEVNRVETTLTNQIQDVKSEVGKAEGRLGNRIDSVKQDLRADRIERRTDMNALRQDIQGLRHDVLLEREDRSVPGSAATPP